MALYQQWTDGISALETQAQQEDFWRTYYDAEQKNYEKILSEKAWCLTGSVKDLAEAFGMETRTFSGFLDGVNTSLETPLDVEALEEDTLVDALIVPDTLYWNMLDAKANWLYELPQWDGVLSEEKRKEITKEYRVSKIAVTEKTVGRNDPCPCGSGKKYKKCCGA